MEKVQIHAVFAFRPGDATGNWLAKVLREARRAGVSIVLSSGFEAQSAVSGTRRKRP